MSNRPITIVAAVVLRTIPPALAAMAAFFLHGMVMEAGAREYKPALEQGLYRYHDHAGDLSSR